MVRRRCRLLVSGRVQGVFFRVWTRRQAQGLQLSGWVRNTEDGKVEVVAEGEEKKLTKLIELIEEKGGSRLAKVGNVQVEWDEEIGEFESFEIRY